MIEQPQTIYRDRGSSIASFFDDMAGKRNAIFRSNPVLDYEQQVRSKEVLGLVAAKAGDTILDIGCGNARDIIRMVRQGAKVVGIDLSPGMIEQAEQEVASAGLADVTLEIGDATQLKYRSDTFDKIVCSEVIEHIPDADAAIAEFHRVLKPGGLLVLSTPNRRSWYGFDRYVLWTGVLRKAWNHPFDNWRSMREVCSLVERHGFRVASRTTASYLPGFLLTYRLPRRLQSAIVWCVGRIERLARRLTPSAGYMIVVSATKR